MRLSFFPQNYVIICNVVLAGTPKTFTGKFQRVSNAFTIRDVVSCGCYRTSSTGLMPRIEPHSSLWSWCWMAVHPTMTPTNVHHSQAQYSKDVWVLQTTINSYTMAPIEHVQLPGFFVAGPTAWNSLVGAVLNSTKAVFIRRVKTFMLSKYVGQFAIRTQN